MRPLVYGAPRLTADLVRRDRLMRRLDERRPLTIVRAPGGSGKTVLVADWGREAGLEGVWLSVDEATSGRMAMWTAVAARIADAGLAGLAPGLEELVSSIGGVSDLRSLLRRAFGTLRRPLLLVLDDFHRLHEPEEVADDVVDVLLASSSLSIVVLTRAPTTLEGGLAGARLDRTLITPAELVLTPEESAEVVARVGAVDPVRAPALHRASGGSALLLRALALGHESGLVGADEAAVTQAVVADLLRGMEEPWRGFMVRTAIAEEFDLPLAEELSGYLGTQHHLDELESQGFLMRSEHVSGSRYRYHPMVREALMAELEAGPADGLVYLRRTAARWCEANGAPKAAVAHAVAAKDLHLVSEILLGHGLALMREGGTYDLLAHLSARSVARYPLVALVLAIGAYARRNHRWRAIEYLTVAITASRVIGPRVPPAERAALSCVEAAALRLLGRPVQGVTAARRALKLLRGEPRSLAPLRDQVGSLRVQSALTLLMAGRPEEARIALTDNLADLGSLPLSPALQTLATMAALQALEGDLLGARRLVGRIEEEDWPTSLRDDYPGAAYHLARAILALEDFDVERIRWHGQVLAPHMDTLEFRPWFACVEALADLIEGHPALGLRRLQRVATSGGRRQLSALDRGIVGPVRALLHLAQGHGGRAEQVLGTLDVKSSGALLLRALHAHLVGDHDRVVSLLARTRTEETSSRLTAMADLLAAAAFLRSGRLGDAAVVLQELACADGSGLRAHLIFVPRRDLIALRGLAEERGLERVLSCLDPQGVPSVLPESAVSLSLTARERVVLRALVEHSGQSEIADQLVVSTNTVKSQLRSLYRKLGAAGREEALSVAYAHGLLDEVEPATAEESELP